MGLPGTGKPIRVTRERDREPVIEPVEPEPVREPAGVPEREPTGV